MAKMQTVSLHNFDKKPLKPSQMETRIKISQCLFEGLRQEKIVFALFVEANSKVKLGRRCSGFNFNLFPSFDGRAYSHHLFIAAI